MRYEVVIIQGDVITNLSKMDTAAWNDAYYKDIRDAARSGNLILSATSKYAIYDTLQKRMTNISFNRNYIIMEDECRKMNDYLLYEEEIKNYITDYK